MTSLRKHMVEDMQLRGLVKNSRAYVRVLTDLARYFRRSPDQLKDEDLRQYFLYLTTRGKLSRSSTTIAFADQILLRNDTSAAVANAGIGASGQTIQAAGRAEP